MVAVICKIIAGVWPVALVLAVGAWAIWRMAQDMRQVIPALPFASRHHDSEEVRAQVDLIYRMLAGALGVTVEDDPAWFKARAAQLACDFRNADAVFALVHLLDVELAELKRLVGVGNGEE